MPEKARELLELAIEEWDSDRNLYAFHKVMEEIRTYLAEPTPDEEPVAWLYSKGDVLAGVPVVFTSATIGKDFAFQEPHYDQKPLYPHPAPRPDFVQLSEEEIDLGFICCHQWGMEGCFRDGVRFAEKHHGIGGEG